MTDVLPQVSRPHVSLRPLCWDDVPRMVETTNDPKIEKPSLFVRQRERGQSKEDVFRGLIAAHANGPTRTFAVLRYDTIVGCLRSVSGPDGTHRTSLGYWIAAGHRDKGIATAAVRCAMEDMGANVPRGVRPVFTAAVSPDNAESLALMRKLGFEEAAEPVNAPSSAMPVRHFILT